MSKRKWHQKPIYALVALTLVLSLGIVAVPMAGTVEADGPHVSGVADGDYIRFGGLDWITLDNATGYVILKDASSIPKQTDPVWMCGPFEDHCRAFDYEYKKINARQEWDYNGTVASLNEWLNDTFYNGLGDDKGFVADGTWNIEAGHPDASATAYDWTGKVGLLTKTEFEYFLANGPNLHGTATKAINYYSPDPNMDKSWWLLTPGTSNVFAVYFVQWGALIVDNAGALTHQVRPTLYLTSGLTTSGGDGSSENPFMVVKPPPPSEVWVDDSWNNQADVDLFDPSLTWQVDAFNRIQDGIDAVAGSTVHVAAGTYDEQVVINKSLTLEGAGDTTIVKPSSAAKLTTILDGQNPYGVTKQIAGIIVANEAGAVSVMVKNLKVDGGAVTACPAGADYVSGIFYRETGGTIDAVTVDNMMVGVADASGYGISLSSVTNTVSVEVKGSTITNFDKNGLDACGSKLTANIHNNTVTGRGPVGDEVQNGIVVAQGTEGTVNHNIISDIYYTGAPWNAIGIAFHNSDGSADNNSVTDSGAGICLENGNFLAEDNNVTGGKYGLTVQYDEPGPWTASVVDNTVSGSEWYGIGVCAGDPGTPDPSLSLTITIDGNQLTGGPGNGMNIGDNRPGAAGSIVATVSNNNIHDWAHGIYILDRNDILDTVSATITGNTIQNNAGAVDSGIHIESDIDATKVQVHFNNIVGNTSTGVYGVYNGGTGTLNATNNWWGANDGPDDDDGVINGSGDKISTNVNAGPWIQFILEANPAQIAADGASQSDLTAKLKNSDGTIVAPDAQLNQLPEFAKVTFTTDKGSVGSLETTKDMTNGQATATLTSSTTVETATIEAQAKDASDNSISGATDSTTVDFIAGTSSTITITADPLNITGDGSSISTITATVKDQYGHPVADGTNVLFETDHGTFASDTITKQISDGVATASLTSESSTETVIATVTATANGASDAASVFFIPEGGAEVEESKTETVTGSGTIEDTPTGGDVSIDATGDHTVTTAKYEHNPHGTPTFEATGDYYDVHLDDDTNVTSLTIEFYPADEDTIIYYWDGTSWRRASDQSYSDGCVVVTVTSSTFPSLSDLTGLVFASGTPPPPVGVGGEAYPVNKLAILAPWIALAAAIIAGGTIFLRRRRAQG